MKRNHYTAAQRRLLENISGFAFISPWLLGFLAFTAVPIVFSLYWTCSITNRVSEQVHLPSMIFWDLRFLTE